MNRAETEDGSYASARNRKLLTEWAAKAGESEYAEPALNPCQTTAFEFFTDDELEDRAHPATSPPAFKLCDRLPTPARAVPIALALMEPSTLSSFLFR